MAEYGGTCRGGLACSFATVPGRSSGNRRERGTGLDGNAWSGVCRDGRCLALDVSGRGRSRFDRSLVPDRRTGVGSLAHVAADAVSSGGRSAAGTLPTSSSQSHNHRHTSGSDPGDRNSGQCAMDRAVDGPGSGPREGRSVRSETAGFGW